MVTEISLLRIGLEKLTTVSAVINKNFASLALLAYTLLLQSSFTNITLFFHWTLQFYQAYAKGKEVENPLRIRKRLRTFAINNNSIDLKLIFIAIDLECRTTIYLTTLKRFLLLLIFFISDK